jgi:hypothetical protein
MLMQFKFGHFPALKLLSQFQPNYAEMILRWSPFKIVSVSAVLYPRWPPLKKIKISSNRQHYSILSLQQSLVEIGSVVSEEKIFF